jgi:large subunit ribosomal protein L32
MAEPKKRTNNSKQGMRRMHDKVVAASLTYCEKCHEPKESHKICYNCGNYKGNAVIDLDKKKTAVEDKAE